MVSVENRITYIDKISESPKLMAFHHFLLGRDVNPLLNTGLNDSDEQFFKILISIQGSNKGDFEDIYSNKSKSNPSKNSPSPFVNDDYLIFCLIVAIMKFDIDRSWIKKIVSIRSRTAMTVTFENILNENFFSTNNQLEIILIFLNLYNSSKINNDLLNTTFKGVKENTALINNKNDFQILCALRAYDLIIELKEAPDGSEIQLLKSFNTNFIIRTKILSWFFQLGAFLAFFYFILKLPVYSPEIIQLINDYGYIFNILGALGFSFLGNQLTFIKQKSQQLTMRSLGYPKEMYEKLKRK